MKKSLHAQAASYRSAHAQKRWRHIAAAALAMAVTLSTAYALILPARTLEQPTYCGYEEHLEHTDDCYQETRTLLCEVPERHTHTEACYEEQPVLICGMEESEAHQHTEECYEVQQVCTCEELESESHRHTDECYLIEQELICEKPLHQHTLACYADLTADVEEQAQWESSFSAAELSEDCRENVLAVAKTQLGYAESSRNYQVEDDAVTKGYTRYGAWYGNPYGDWCAMFCAFCIRYAGLETYPVHANCQRWVELLTDAELYRENGSYEPIPGDLVFFDRDGDGTADHMGFVCELTETEPAKIRTIEGNSGDCVRYVTYDSTDAAIMGYGGLDDAAGSAMPKLRLLAAQNSTYYQRVTSLSEISAGDRCLIVSAEGNYALTYNNSANSTKMTLTPVKGNPGYYAVDGVDDTMLWTFSNNNIRNAGSNIYLRMSSNLFGSARALNCTYNSVGGTWTIRYSGYYLRNDGTAFSRSDSNSNSYQRNMLILREVHTALDIPDDVIAAGSIGGGDGAEKVQPQYAPDTAFISGAKQGTLTDIDTVIPDAMSMISGSYASDPATSQIEDSFFSTAQSGREPSVNDGKILADKSVIYRGDDYGAYSDYDEGIFGVTLSVLGQDYQLKAEDQVKVPVDVVFVLDVSGSMENNKTAEGITRTRAVVNAVNTAMDTVMADNPENRAGVVLYSSGGSTLLGLDHYTGRNHRYLEHDDGDIYTISGLSGTSGSIERHNGEGGGFTQGHGTYTQYGIALGAKLLQDNTDTTYTTTLNKGTDFEKQVTVIRQPLIILLSDGDPTHCTSNYMDVLSGPAYGDGVYPSISNNKGVQGYYTILSANYYKRMVGIHYNAPARFYTIGMGINATGYKDMSGASSTGDCYKRAVLNPTAANVADLVSNGARTTNPNDKRDYRAEITWPITCQMLNQLLSSSYGEDAVTVGSVGSYAAAIGATNSLVPVLPNPYSDSYGYADGAYFGNLGTEQLKEIFGSIIQSSLNVKSYGYMLAPKTSVELTDTIGEGMEMKGTPVLRYNGRNYPLTETAADGVRTYTCHATATTTDGSGVNGRQRTVDLSEITIRVTESGGRQTVFMAIPETAVPSYTPDVDADWYYEELPVRLIYQVGLTDEARQEVDEMPLGESCTYYTNAWEGTSASAVQSPNADNPYYHDVTYDSGISRAKQYRDYAEQKTANTTGTAGTSAVSRENAGKTQITMYLGNNGKLTFTNNGPKATSIELYKVDMNGKPVVGSKAEFALYTDVELKHRFGGTYVTNPATGIATIPDLKVNATYYLVETKAPNGYIPLPEAEAITVGKDGKLQPIAGSTYLTVGENGLGIYVKNTDGYRLPDTGGTGTAIYVLGGLLLIGTALTYSRGRKREGGTG